MFKKNRPKLVNIESMLDILEIVPETYISNKKNDMKTSEILNTSIIGIMKEEKKNSSVGDKIINNRILEDRYIKDIDWLGDIL